MPDEFGGVEVEESPDTTDEFGGVALEEEAPVKMPEFPRLAEGATLAEALRQPTPVGVLPPTSIVPAIKLIGGEIVPGELGDTHPDIIRREGLEAEDIDKRMFQTPIGPLDRDQAAVATGLKTEFEPGQLHSTDLIRAMESIPAEPKQPEFVPPVAITEQGPIYQSQLGPVVKPIVPTGEEPWTAQQILSAPIKAAGGMIATGLNLISPTTWLPQSERERLAVSFGDPRTPAEQVEAKMFRADKPLYQPQGTAIDPEASDMERLLSQWSTPESMAMFPLGMSRAGAAVLLTQLAPSLLGDIKAVIAGEGTETEKRDRINNLFAQGLLIAHGAGRGREAIPTEVSPREIPKPSTTAIDSLRDRIASLESDPEVTGKRVIGRNPDGSPKFEDVAVNQLKVRQLENLKQVQADVEIRPTPAEPAPTPKPEAAAPAAPTAPAEGFVQTGGLTTPKIWNWLNKRYGIKEGGRVVMEDFGPGTEDVAADTRYAPKIGPDGKPMVDASGVLVPDRPTRIRINTRATHTAKTLEGHMAEEFAHWYDIENRARSEEIVEGMTPDESATLRATITKRYEPGVREFEMRAQGIELLARKWRERPWFEKFVLEVKDFLSDKLGVKVTDKLLRARAEKVAVRAIMQAAERVRGQRPAAAEVAPKPAEAPAAPSAPIETKPSAVSSIENGRVTYRAPATGKKSRWVKVNGEWFRADSQWNPKGKPLEPMGLRDALDKKLISKTSEGALEARMATEEKPAEGTVRLYRGTKGEGIESSWFTERPERARSFGQFVSYVDVPREVADKYRALIKTDYVLPDEWIRQAKRVAQPIPEKVWDVEGAFQGRLPDTIPGDRVVTIEKTDPDGKVTRYIGSWNPEKSYDLRSLPQYGRIIPQVGKVTPVGWSHGLLAPEERIIDDGGAMAMAEGSFQAKVTPGMGAAQAGEKPKAAQIEQLTQALEGVRASKAPVLQQVKQSFNIGQRLATAKDAVGQAVAGLKSAGDILINKWKGVENIDDMLRAKGELSKEIEARGWRLRQWEKMAKKAIPDTRDQAAIAKWVDAGGDAAVLQEGLNNAPAQYKQAYADALKLSGDKLVAAQNVQNYFDARLQEAIDAGVLEQGVENYIHRMYESRPDLQKKALTYTQSGLLKTNPSMAKKRVFQFDWEAEKLGYKPVQSFIKRITAYEASLTKAIAAREFIKKTTSMKAKDGRPIVDIKGVGIPIDDPAGVYREATLITPKYSSSKSNEATLPNGDPNPNYRGDYVHRDYRALSRWKWVSTDAEGKPIFVQGDVAIHPDYVGRVDALLQPSQVRFGKYGKILRPALGASSVMKQTMLDMSGFHQVQITVHGMEHKVMPWNIIREIDLSSPDVDGLLKGGLTLGGDYSGAYREGLVGSSLTRLIPGLGNIVESYHQWLFQDYIPRIKTTMALNALRRNRARFGDRMTDEAIFRKTANQANAAFGELNYTMLERSKTAQDISRLILLAPDFLEARARFAAQAFEKGGKRFGNEQRMALLLGALTMYVTARIANKIIDGQYHEEPENLFNIVYNRHSYGLRTVQGDILHLLNKPLQFWTSRLNPVYGRTLLEGLTGRDYFGRKRSAAEQAWDAASTVIPISLRSNRERKLWESLLNGFGVTARRWSDVDDAFKLAATWKEQHGIGERGEFIYDPNKDALRPLKLALNHGDESGAAKEIKTLIDSGAYNIKRLDQYFKRYAAMPFAGSKDNDKKFIGTLTEDQRKTVEAARQHKIEIAKLYRKSRGQYLAPAVSETPETPATDEFGGVPLE